MVQFPREIYLLSYSREVNILDFPTFPQDQMEFKCKQNYFNVTIQSLRSRVLGIYFLKKDRFVEKEAHFITSPSFFCKYKIKLIHTNIPQMKFRYSLKQFGLRICIGCMYVFVYVLWSWLWLHLVYECVSRQYRFWLLLY